jgi:hypothetical protein
MLSGMTATTGADTASTAGAPISTIPAQVPTRPPSEATPRGAGLRSRRRVLRIASPTFRCPR